MSRIFTRFNVVLNYRKIYAKEVKLMGKQKWRVLLLVLIVILLFIVSSRVSPQLPNAEPPSVSVPDSPEVSDSPASPSVGDDTPAVTPPVTTPDVSEPPVEEIDLPDVSIHEWNLKLVNNNNILSSSFTPDVSEIVDGQYFDSRAVDALYALLDGARMQGFSTYVSAAYRPFSTQAYIFNGKASQIAWPDGDLAEAEKEARKIVAYPGTSEHQLGLAVDIIDSANTSLIAEDVEDMPLLVWLKEHCHEYGFILRYPKDKEEITDWYEPWHFRYVGTTAAKYIMENNLCLEEFLDLYRAQ